MKKIYFDFDNEVVLGSDILTKYDGKDLVLKEVYKYEGPITMQYNPNGGIQSVFAYNLIIQAKGMFIAPKSIIYNKREMTTKEFVTLFDDLVNVVLPC